MKNNTLIESVKEMKFKSFLMGLVESGADPKLIQIVGNGFKLCSSTLTESVDVKVTFDNGNSLQTTINTDLEGAKAYYIGKQFNIGTGGHDLMAKAVAVELIPDEPETTPGEDVTRHYRITYDTVSPDNDSGDYDDVGSVDEFGTEWSSRNNEEQPEDIEITAEAEFEENIVDMMFKILRNNGANENSGDDTSYRTPDENINMNSGDRTTYTFHLIDFTPEELSQIAAKIH